MNSDQDRHAVLSPVQALLNSGGKVEPTIVFPWVRFREDQESTGGTYAMSITLTDENASETFVQLEARSIKFGSEARSQITKRIVELGFAEII